MPVLITNPQSTRHFKTCPAFGLHDPNRRKTHYFHKYEDYPIIIGRDRRCPIRVIDLWVSRKHAAIEWQCGQAWIRDFGWGNGTYVDRKRIPTDHWTALRVGMTLQVCKSLLIAVDKDGSFPISARTIPEFCHLASVLYGSCGLAATHVGKGIDFIIAQAKKWKQHLSSQSGK